MLQLPNKNSKAAIIKMLQCALMNKLEANEKLDSLTKK